MLMNKWAFCLFLKTLPNNGEGRLRWVGLFFIYFHFSGGGDFPEQYMKGQYPHSNTLCLTIDDLFWLFLWAFFIDLGCLLVAEHFLPSFQRLVRRSRWLRRMEWSWSLVILEQKAPGNGKIIWRRARRNRLRYFGFTLPAAGGCATQNLWRLTGVCQRGGCTTPCRSWISTSSSQLQFIRLENSIIAVKSVNYIQWCNLLSFQVQTPCETQPTKWLRQLKRKLS